MKRVTFIAFALAMAVLAVLAGRVAAQETNTSERTFLTFSSAVEMPGVTLQPGTYVFKLADTPSRNVVQVYDGEQKDIIGQWLFVQAERPQVTGENVIMFKEERAGATPAVQFWYFPGEKIGKEFIYPKDQALKIAQRTGVAVRSEDGVVEGGGAAAIQQAEAAQSTLNNAPASAQPTAAAGSLAGNRGVQVEPEADRPALQVVEVAPAPERAVGTSGQARAEELPRTASPLALTGLMGLLSLAGALALRSTR